MSDPGARSHGGQPGLPALTGRSGPLRFDVRRHVEVDSTSRVVTDLARQGADEGVVVVADHQTAGRGRLGRRWEAPPGSSLLVSVLLRPAMDPTLVQLVTVAAGVAAARACRTVTGVQPGLKWPNDLVVDDLKLGGILTELVLSDKVQGPSGPSERGVVVGLGLNVSWKVALPAGATALDRLTDADVDRDALLAAFLDQLAEGTHAFGEADPRRQLLDRYRALCSTLGRRVTAGPPGEQVTGRATAIGPRGELVVERGDGTVHRISAGTVAHLAERAEP